MFVGHGDDQGGTRLATVTAQPFPTWQTPLFIAMCVGSQVTVVKQNVKRQGHLGAGL